MVRNVAPPPRTSVRVLVPRSAKRKRRSSPPLGWGCVVVLIVARKYQRSRRTGCWLNQAGMESINQLGQAEFVERFGPLFEHSPWVAEDAWSDRPFADVDELFEALRAAMYAAPRDRQLALIRAHPDLAGKAAIEGTLTRSSKSEQASAGLDRLTPDEYEAFTRTNTAYRERFGFPFVVCVREHTKESILRVAAERLEHTRDEEVRVALEEIAKIARLRMKDVL
jgi:OHCU decarboxylase